jgi:hypothetical protein
MDVGGLWLPSYGEEVEGRASSVLGRNVVLCVWKIAHELTRFRVLVILFPYLSPAYEQFRALQTRVVTEQTVFGSLIDRQFCRLHSPSGTIPCTCFILFIYIHITFKRNQYGICSLDTEICCLAQIRYSDLCVTVTTQILELKANVWNTIRSHGNCLSSK